MFSGETASLSEFGLSTEQQQYFQEMELHTRVDIFSKLLITNRLGKAIDGLPWTTKLFGADLGQIASRLTRLHHPRMPKNTAKPWRSRNASKRDFATNPQHHPICWMYSTMR